VLAIHSSKVMQDRFALPFLSARQHARQRLRIPASSMLRRLIPGGRVQQISPSDPHSPVLLLLAGWFRM